MQKSFEGNDEIVNFVGHNIEKHLIIIKPY